MNAHVFTNTELGLEVTVTHSDLHGGWVLRLHDTDAGMTLPMRRIFPIEQDALRYANRCLFPLEQYS